MRNRFKSLLLTAAAAALLFTTTACNDRLQALSSFSFGSGFLAGMLIAPTTTETICYLNGVEVDCSELPE